MTNLYSMTVLNIIYSAIVLGGFLIYKYIYPRKNVNLLILLTIVSILPIVNIFRPGDYESGDFNIHIYRTISFYQNLLQGNFMPSWAGELNATFGYPVFIFLNPLPYYLQSFIHLLGISFINSLKILLAISYIFSGIFFYLFAKKEVKNNLAAFVGAIVYLFAPYHLVDLNFRAAIGEVTFFVFLPLFFYSILNFKKQKNLIWFLTSSLSFSLMIFSHQAMAVFSLFIIIPYFVFWTFKSDKFFKQFFLYLLTVVLGLMYSLCSWLPHIIYPKYTLAFLLTREIVSFPKIQELIYSTWRYGFLFQGPKGELSFIIGYPQILILLIGVLIVLRQRKKSKSLINSLSFWVLISGFIIFMMTPFSWIIWKAIPILNTAQFASRLLLLLTLSISMAAVYASIVLKKFPFLIFLFVVITIGYTMLNWEQRRVIPEISDPQLINNLPKSTSEGEGFCCMAQPKWILPDAKWVSVIPTTHIEIIKGKGQAEQVYRTNTLHEYVTYSDEMLIVKENTWYFPGWKLSIDGKTTVINFSNKKYPGIISFAIPAGLHRIVLSYQDIPELLIAKIISTITISVSLLLMLFLFFGKVIKK